MGFGVFKFIMKTHVTFNPKYRYAIIKSYQSHDKLNLCGCVKSCLDGKYPGQPKITCTHAIMAPQCCQGCPRQALMNSFVQIKAWTTQSNDPGDVSSFRLQNILTQIPVSAVWLYILIICSDVILKKQTSNISRDMKTPMDKFQM